MDFLSIAYALLFYFATFVLVVGVGRKIVQYARTPAPLKIPTTPAPTTGTGVALRLGGEVVFFSSLFKSNKWIWLFGWLFHFCLFLEVLRHLRYFIHPVWWWVTLVQPFGKYASYGVIVGLLGLWGRRFFVDRVRYISSPSDHLMLALLLGIAGSGTLMTFVDHTDIVSLKAFTLGLLYGHWQPLPHSPLLLIHLGLVAALMIVFPFSKLLHGPGLLFSPTRNQIDNPREKRHVAPWAADSGTGAAG